MLISPRLVKVLRDLWGNKMRTLLVVLSIAVGVTGIGVVAGIQYSIARNLPASYAQVNPAHATLTTDPFDEELVKVISVIDGVREVDARYSLNVRLQVGKDQWRDLELVVIPDFNNMLINKVWRENGSWPPGEHEVSIERTSLSLVEARVGDTVTIQTHNGKTRQLKISGLAYDLNEAGGLFSNQARGFITLDTLEWMGYNREFNELLITVDGRSITRDKVQKIANSVQDKVAKSGREIYWITIPDPDQHWFESFLSPMSAVLGSLGGLALLLSGFLVINIISALIALQIRQIGVMKAIGGHGYQIASMYILLVLLIGILALAAAVPLSKYITGVAVQFLTSYINFDMPENQYIYPVIYLQTVLSLLMPVVVAFFPIFSGTRVTVREALGNYGIGQGSFGKSWLDRMLVRISTLPRPLLLSLRNTARRKDRLVLTLITLSIAGAIFISVSSVQSSLITTLDEALKYYGFDVMVFFTQPYRIDQIQNEMNKVSGIQFGETWGVSNAHRVRTDKTESDNILLVAPPVGTQVIRPNVVKGRWLLPEDENAVVINTDVLVDEPDIQVGDTLTLKVDNEKTKWKVVGIVQSVMIGPWMYTNYPYYAKVFNKTNHASALYVTTSQHDINYQTQVAQKLEDQFDTSGLRTNGITKVAELRETMITQFNVLVVFLMTMALLLAVVGGLGLMGTMSLNIMERTREIGVMRAIGASDGSLFLMVIVEGVLIGLISGVIGALLAIPFSQMLSEVVGMSFLQTPLVYSYSREGVLQWLGLVVLLSTLSSLIPAFSAAHITVRDALAYE